MTKPLSKRPWIISLSITLLIVVLLLLSNKTLTLSIQDKAYIDSFRREWNMHETPQTVHKDFQSEYLFIEKLEHSVLNEICHKEISHSMFGNMSYYFKEKMGFCYDRAVLMEKVFLYYGFPFRHIFIYYPSEKDKDPGLYDFFRKSTESHAVLEVKTKNGWMLMDSNSDWIGLSKNGKPFTIKDLRADLYDNGKIDLKEEYTNGVPFWKEHPKFNYVYGFYSRNGSFFSPHIGLPEVNLRMLLYNF